MIKTKKYGDSFEDSDGTRILITRYPIPYRKRTDWKCDEWIREIAPSENLHAAWYGRKRVGRRVVARDLAGISWEEYKDRFLREMKSPASQESLQELRRRSQAGEIITLLCHCKKENRCHRTLVKRMITGW